MILCSLCAVPATSAAKTPTVPTELNRLAAEGAITPEVAAQHRTEWLDARKQLKRLTGPRKVQLGGVLNDMQGMAARNELTPSRLPSLFLTITRNTEYWPSQPLLNYGARLSFPGSELVYGFYPGHGVQIQWLATFGKLNGYWSGGKRYDTRASALLDEIVSLAAERAGGLAWEYLFPFDGQNPPWVSSLSQGTALQAMARSATRLNRQAEIFPIAQRGLGIFQTSPPQGVRIADGNGAHYLEYSGLPRLKILNGFIQSLNGLYDFAGLTGDTTAQSLFASGELAARDEVSSYDTGAWSLYSTGSITRESDLSYHKLLRDFLGELCKRTQTLQYCSAKDHFTAYLTTPPALQVVATTTTAKKAGKLRFKLSKISRVTLKVSKDGQTVATYTPGTLGYGTKTLTWTAPKHSGDYDVTVTATDLAGNTATAAGQVHVKKRT
jgi:hypothetical protein